MEMHVKPRLAPHCRWRLGWSVFLALLPVLWLSTSVYAQTVPFKDSGQTLGTENSYQVALGDLDGDGDLDAFVVNRTQQPDTVWLNDGYGHMTDSGQALDSFSSRDIALGDVDGDGDLDAVIANAPFDNASNSNAHDALWLNDGHGKFTLGPQPWGYQQSNAIALADLNGDGALDLFWAGAASSIGLNDGVGNFSQGQSTSVANIQDVVLGDLDRDSDVDAFLVVEHGIQIWRNEGQGGFTPLDLILDNNIYHNAALADLDSDGDLDAFVTAGVFEVKQPSQPNIVWRNDVTGVLTTTQQFTATQQLDFVMSGETNEGAVVVLGDVDGDGDIDAYVPERDRSNDALFLNNGQGVFAPGLAIPSPLFSEGAALGDLNGDGHLDIFLTNAGEQTNQVFFNTSSMSLQDTGQSLGNSCGPDVALGDLDGNGTLDAIVANAPVYGSSPGDTVWLNQGKGIFAVGTALPNSPSWGVALGDLDGNGSLDAFFVQDFANQVWLNNGQGQLTANGQTLPGNRGRDVALGDLDSDGDLDAFVTNGDNYGLGGPKPNSVWLNNGHGQFTDSGQQLGNGASASVALGDLDSDGDLDAVVANERVADLSQIWLNDGQGIFSKSAELDVSDAQGVVLGDLDSDGDLDAFFANGFYGQPERIFFNDGAAHFTASPQILSATSSTDAAIGDLDNDGDLDVLVTNFGSNEVFVNDGTGHFSVSQLTNGGIVYYSAVALGDLDGDGQLDAFTPRFNVNGDSQYCYSAFGDGARVWHNANGSPQRGYLRTTRPGPVANADFYSTPAILDQLLIPVTYSLDITATQAARQISLYYSFNGGGQWLPASTQAQPGPAFPLTAGTNSITWDTFASGFLGASDNVALRMLALSVPPSAQPGVYHYPNSVAGTYQWPFIATTTFPFRVRGTQVRVMQGNTGAANALVYRLPQGQTTSAVPIADQTGVPYHTDSLGYLQGRGRLAIGDRLVALAPITATESYTLYNMSATPTLNGLDFYTVTTSGVQTLTVAATHPLLLLNLDVALEWDARKDTAFLNQLEFDLRRTSEFLFDATDGQAALGEITLYDNKENWDRADIRIYASNAMIPNADPGGIVSSNRSEVITANPFIGATAPYSITYQTGHIRIGAVWNRFGEATGTLGEDWPRTLAHELGHYAFYLYDNYLGLKNGVVVPVSTCIGTLMTDQYREDFSEFHAAKDWAKACAQTISAQRSGRSDWETITHFYPWLKQPVGQPNRGPETLPLAVTQVQSRFAATPTLPLTVNVFDLVNPAGAAQTSSPRAQAVLYTSEGRLLDLGHPVVDKLEARGAHVGDRLCVYDQPKGRLGCETISANDLFLTLVGKPSWQPEIVVSPVTSRTVNVLVSNVDAGLPLKGKLYPENSAATAEIPFVPWPSNSYSTTFQLSAGVLAGHIQIWVEEAATAQNPRGESLTSYALGGSPGKRASSANGNKSLAVTAQAGSKDVTPAIAPDGQVLIYGNVNFSDGEFYALQKANRLPIPPLWTTVVGDGYRILKSAKAPDLVNTSILFRYRGQDVPAGEERFLSLYYWDEPAQHWDKLPTVLNKDVNEASAQAPGPGLYVLMSSLEIPLRQAGWNLVAYPVQQTRPVTEALASIAFSYTLVYGYVVTDTLDPWKVYAPSAPAYVNDLKKLEFGQGYWVNATEAMTWQVKGPEEGVVQAANSLALPPATYYGAVFPAPGFVPVAGLPVQALINGAVCGAGVTQAVGGQIVYTLNVVGDGSANGACAGAGQPITFTIAGTPRGRSLWQNNGVQQVNLGIGSKLYLTEVHR